MNDIRKQDPEEKAIIEYTFKFPLILKISFFASLLLSMFFIVISFLWNQSYAPINGGILTPGILFLILSIVLLLQWYATSKLRCTITSRMIYCNKAVWLGFGLKHYSFRLDRIDTVEGASLFGITAVKLLYSDGNFNQSTNVGLTNIKDFIYAKHRRLKLYFVSNVNEVVNQINSLILSIKNDRDLSVDMTIKALEAEKDKANALHRMSSKDHTEG